MADYFHVELNQEFYSKTGYFLISKENKIRYKGRDVLYIIGQACVEAGCCGIGSWKYISVPGYVINWHYRQNETGLPITEIETVNNQQDQDEIKRIIQEVEKDISRIDFR